MNRIAAAALLCLAATPALARERMALFNRTQPSETRLAVGLRGGYAVPFGEAESGVDYADVFKSAFPATFEIGGRGEHVFFGVYYQYAPVKAAECPPGDSCSGWLMRAGAELLYTVAPARQVSPWFGMGMGWEGIQTKDDGGKTRADGFEFANLQLGFDVKASPQFVVGPYATVSFARFGSVDGEKIAQPATHEWLQLGLRTELRF